MIREGVNRTLVKLIFQESVANYNVLDVGCGAGALSFIVAAQAKNVIGIDISEGAIDNAKRRARKNMSFRILDADTSDYTRLGEINMIVSHLCMSDKIIENCGRALQKGGVFVFACFHEKHLIEGGRRSRFSYTEGEMRQKLDNAGFIVEYLEVETEKVSFSSLDEAIEIIGQKTSIVGKEMGAFRILKDLLLAVVVI